MAIDVSKIPNNNKFDPVREAILQLQSDVQNGVSGVGSINGQDGLITITGASPISVSTVGTTITIGIDSSDYLSLSDTGLQTIAGDLTISGDLVVNGDTTTINTSELSVEDINITIASGATLPSQANGAGITIAGANATMTYNSTSDRLVFNKSIEASLVGNVTGNVTGDLTGNADTATALETARNIAISGAVVGNANFDGTGNITISTSVNHNHDSLYYTKSEIDAFKYVQKGDANPNLDNDVYFSLYGSPAPSPATNDAFIIANTTNINDVTTTSTETPIVAIYRNYEDGVVIATNTSGNNTAEFTSSGITLSNDTTVTGTFNASGDIINLGTDANTGDSIYNRATTYFKGNGYVLDPNNSSYSSLFYRYAGGHAVTAYKFEVYNEYTLPLTDGTSGQVIATDGFGNLSFVDPSGAGSITLQDVTDNGATTTNSISFLSGLSGVGTIGNYFNSLQLRTNSGSNIEIGGSGTGSVQNNLIIKDGSIGVNVTSPSTPIHLVGSGGYITLESTDANAGAGVRIDSGTREWSIFTNNPLSNRLVFRDVTANEYRMVIDTSGNVGIGTTSPETLLHVSSGTSGDAIVIIEADTDNNTEGDVPQIWFRADGGINESAIINNDNVLELLNNVSSGGGIAFSTGLTNNYNLTSPTTGASTRMFITSAGDVGIGTTSPTSKLTIGTGTFSAAGTGTTGIYTDATNGLTILSDAMTINTRGGTERMRINSSGNVGIGTTSPSSKLHVVQTSDNSGIIISSSSFRPEISFVDDATGDNFKIGHNRSTSDLYIEIDDTPAHAFSNNGRFGIGTISPAAKLDVNSGGEAIRISGSGTGSAFTGWLSFVDSGGTRRGYVGSGSSGEDSIIINADTGLLRFRAGNADRMYILGTNGNVGIGTTSPSYTLDVAGSIRATSAIYNNNLIVSNSSQTRDKIRVWTSSSYTIGMKSGYTYGHLNNDYAMSFQMNNDNDRGFWWGDDAHTDAQGAMSLTTSGRLTVATSISVGEGESVTSPNTTSTFNVKGADSITSAINIECGSFSKSGVISWPFYGAGFDFVNNAGQSRDAAVFKYGTSTVGRITINSTTTTYATTSDYRLKENVTEMTESIEKLKLLKPCKFNFIGNDDVVDGFIAHEVQEVIPEAVTGEKDGIGWDGQPEYQGIDQSKLVPLLTAALQEAVAKIEALEQRILTLENK